MAKFKVGISRPSETSTTVSASSEREARDRVERMNRDNVVVDVKPTQYRVSYYRKPSRSDRYVEIDARNERDAIERVERQHRGYTVVEVLEKK